jgi:hypothetical protein
MGFERQLSRFPCGIFYRAHLSQKPSFLRGQTGDANVLNFDTPRAAAMSDDDDYGKL